MGNKRNCVWILELYVDREKVQLLKVYEFNTMRDVGYVLNMTPSTVSNFYHNLINARGNLEYINIYQKKKWYNYRHATNNHRTRCARGLLVRGARPRSENNNHG